MTVIIFVDEKNNMIKGLNGIDLNYLPRVEEYIFYDCSLYVVIRVTHDIVEDKVDIRLHELRTKEK